MQGLRLTPFSRVLEDFQAGKLIIMVDDERRENEGDLIVAAERASPEALSFMMHQARGLICVTIGTAVAQSLNLPLQTPVNNSVYQTPFAVSIDHRQVASKGVTAQSRAFTIRHLTSESASAGDFVSPGHVFPLIAHPAGVLGRQGQTEGSYDLARLAGFKAAGVLCEILNPDGTMARGSDLSLYAEQHHLSITSVAEVIRYRIFHEVLVRRIGESRLITDFGEFQSSVFVDDADGKEHLVLVYGEQAICKPDAIPLVRIHSECLTGDVFGSRRCDCGEQLMLALRNIVAEGAGILIYLRQEGRGIGLGNKVKAYALQDQGDDTVEANVRLGFRPDERDFAVAAKILSSLGIKRLRLMTNNPDKCQTLARFGAEVDARIPLLAPEDDCSRNYLATKRTKMGHWL